MIMPATASLKRRAEETSVKILCNRYKEVNIRDFITFSPKESGGLASNSENVFTFNTENGGGEILVLSELKQILKEKKETDGREFETSDLSSFVTSLLMSEATDVVKKTKKKKRISTICLANCKYGVIKRIAKEFGMKEVEETDLWNVFWTDLSISVERAKEMKRFQKVNHFPGMSEICRKDLLARNLNRMLKMFPKDYNFFPKSWCIPADLGEVFNYAKSHPTKTYIIKPDIGCQGKGIFLTKSLKELRNIRLYERMICQVYISKPFLVDGFKFDMRVYTLITCVDPLRIFVYNDGLARFATSRYKEPAGHNTTNLYMHLTNYAVNKHSRTYVVDDEAGSKRRLSTVNHYLKKMNEDVDKLWASIDDIIIKTIISAHPVLKHSYHTCFSTHDIMYACFELLGFDILLDNKLKPYILEVNHSPSFHTDAQLDKDVKESLLTDTFNILNLTQCHRKRAMDEDKQRARERLFQALNPQNKLTESSKSDGNQNSSVDGTVNDFSIQVEKWEMSHLGNFRLIYPNNNIDKYKEFFEQNQCSIFQETFASRAREEAQRIQREEFESKMRLELSLRIENKEKEIKEKDKVPRPVEPESPPVMKRKLPTLKKKIERSLCSFEPSKIEDYDEMERVASMTQRDYLVRSCGILEQIYQMMKQGGNLRITDVMKYGELEKIKSKNKSESPSIFSSSPEIKSLIKILPKIKETDARKVSEVNDITNFPIKYTLLEPPFEKCVMGDHNSSAYHSNSYNTSGYHSRINSLKMLDQNFSKTFGIAKQRAFKNQLPELRVTCNEAAMWTRPNLPDPSEWPNKLRAKSTRTFIARHFSNTLKLQDMESRLNGDRELNEEHQSTL